MALQLTILSPEVELLSTTCDFVALPADQGELGVLKGHAPLVSRLGFGELRVKTDGNTARYYVSGGYVQISGDEISVLTEKAVAGASLDKAALAAELEAAKAMPTTTIEEVAARRRAIDETKRKQVIADKS